MTIATRGEVDLLLVHPDGRLVPIEVKASTSVGPGDTSGLLAFAAAHTEEYYRGIVIYDGRRVVDLTPNDGSCEILAVPMSRL